MLGGQLNDSTLHNAPPLPRRLSQLPTRFTVLAACAAIVAAGRHLRGRSRRPSFPLTTLSLAGSQSAITDSQCHEDLWVATVIATKLGPEQLAAFEQTLKRENLQITSIRSLSDNMSLAALQAVDFHVRGVSGQECEVAASLRQLADSMCLDVALQKDDVHRGICRLAVFDMDSTLIQAEVIDELAAEAGVGAQVAAITDAAMRGEVDFEESLHRRVSTLAGLSTTTLETVARRVRLSPGAVPLFRVLREMGCRTALLSGGFTYFAHLLQDKLGIDYVHANALEVADGQLTGRVVGPVITAGRKASLLKDIAAAEGVPLQHVAAVGDGANDLPMLLAAGRGMAFHAKPTVRASAKFQINHAGLDALVYLLGIPDNRARLPATELPQSITLLATSGEKKPPLDPAPASYRQTSGPVKWLVSALTDAVNAVVEGIQRNGERSVQEAPNAEDPVPKADLTPEELMAAIAEDYVGRNYLWTGNIQPEIYQDDCRWTDPTLSFKGLTTFQRNVRNLRAVVDRFVLVNGTDLLSIELENEKQQVRSRWRMWGTLNLPWRPRIDVIGCTTFSYDPTAGNRISRYDETWEVSAATALLQIVTPAPKEGADRP